MATQAGTGVTVRWLASDPSLKLHVRSASHALDRVIRQVQTIEHAEPFAWLAGGELVLTTGMSLPSGDAPGDEAVRRNYVEGLAAAEVPALGFGIGLSHKAVPQDLLRTAERVGLPVLEVPRATPFAALARAVTDRIAATEYTALLRASRAQPRMTRAILTGGPGPLVRELASATGFQVAIADQTGAVGIAHPLPLDPETAALAIDLAAARHAATSAQDAAGRTVIVQAIGSPRRAHGYLVAVTPGPPDAVAQVLLGHATSLLALDRAKPERLRDDQARLNATALRLALDGLGPADLLSGAAGPDGLVRVLTVVPGAQGAGRRIVDAMDSALLAQGRGLWAISDGESARVLLHGSEDPARAVVLTSAAPAADVRSTRFGLSRPYTVDQIDAAASESALAADAAAPGERPAVLEQLTGGVLLAVPATRTVLSGLGAQLLAPIHEHDSENGTELAASLRAFLEANGNWESASAALGIHRHTLRTRIRRIEELLGYDLGPARVRAELLLAMIAGGR